MFNGENDGVRGGGGRLLVMLLRSALFLRSISGGRFVGNPPKVFLRVALALTSAADGSALTGACSFALPFESRRRALACSVVRNGSLTLVSDASSSRSSDTRVSDRQARMLSVPGALSTGTDRTTEPDRKSVV